MSTIVYTALAALLAYATVIAHELAHVRAMASCGIRVEEMGFGLPRRPRITFAPTARRPYRLSLSPWLIGAYVQARGEDHDTMDQLSYRDRAWIAGAGITINITIGLGVLTVSAAAHQRWVPAAVIGATAALIWWARRAFVAYIVPALAVPSIAFIAWLLLTPYRSTPAEYVARSTTLLPDNPLSAAALAGVASLVLGAMNMLPFRPLDGGHIFKLATQRLFGERGAKAVNVVMITGGVALLASDIVFLGWLALG